MMMRTKVIPRTKRDHDRAPRPNRPPLLGPEAFIGYNCTIGPEAFIGGDTVVGAGCVVGVGAVGDAVRPSLRGRAGSRCLSFRTWPGLGGRLPGAARGEDVGVTA